MNPNAAEVRGERCTDFGGEDRAAFAILLAEKTGNLASLGKRGIELSTGRESFVHRMRSEQVYYSVLSPLYVCDRFRVGPPR